MEGPSVRSWINFKDYDAESDGDDMELEDTEHQVLSEDLELVWNKFIGYVFQFYPYALFQGPDK